MRDVLGPDAAQAAVLSAGWEEALCAWLSELRCQTCGHAYGYLEHCYRCRLGVDVEAGVPIAVRRDNPPRYVVTVSLGPEDTMQTWPFESLEHAERAYALAVQSGKFVFTLSTGKGPLALTLVSLWRREDGTTTTGEPAVSYVEMQPRSKEGMDAQGR